MSKASKVSKSKTPGLVQNIELQITQIVAEKDITDENILNIDVNVDWDGDDARACGAGRHDSAHLLICQYCSPSNGPKGWQKRLSNEKGLSGTHKH